MRVKKYRGILFGFGMAILWSVVFVQALHSPAGIGVGVCFGVAFGASMTASMRKTKGGTQGQNDPGKDE